MMPAIDREVLNRSATDSPAGLGYIEFAPPPDLATWIEGIAIVRPPARLPGRKWRLIADARRRARLALDSEGRCGLLRASLIPADVTIPQGQPHVIVRFTPWSEGRFAGGVRDDDSGWTMACRSWVQESLAWLETDNASRVFGVVCEWLRGVLPDEEPDPRAVAAWSALVNAAPSPGIGDLAGIAGTSPRSLLRAFRSECVCSPVIAQQLERMRTALRLLRTDLEKTWTRAALEAGFCDHSHFNRAFRQWAGMAPGRFFAEGHHHANDVFARQVDGCGLNGLRVQAVGSPALRNLSEVSWPARHHRRSMHGRALR
jgi:AraC-like DNA-binding protein